MSYCVNCGVELRESETHCPLCDTKVMNPRRAYNDSAERAYPRRNDIILASENRVMTVILMTVLTMLPALTCLIVDYVIRGKCSWSLYVVIAMGVAWAFVVPLFLIKRKRTIFALLIDTVALLTGLWFLERITESGGWFVPLALPLVLSSALFILITILVAKHIVFGVLKMISFSFSFAALLVIAIEIVTDMYIDKAVQLEWSLIVFIPLVLLATASLIIDRKRIVKDEMKKKLHI